MTLSFSSFAPPPLLLLAMMFLALLADPCEAKAGAGEALAVKDIATKFPDFKPRAIIDVGANWGVWTTYVRETLYPEAKYLMLEATPNKDEPLRKIVAAANSKAEYRIAVLSERSGQTVSFFQGGDTGNSMFKENTKFYADDKPVNRTTTTLDEVIEQSALVDFDNVDILKLDVQGAELMVLKGGTKTLKQATFVVFESGTIEFNAGGACLYELDEFLRSFGFFLYDFGKIDRSTRLFKTPGAGQFDVMYAKPSSPRLPEKLANAKFCGQGRGGDGSAKSSPASPKATKAADTAASVGGSENYYIDSERVLKTLDGNLQYVVEKRRQRPGIFFLLGLVSGVLLTSAYQRIRRLRLDVKVE